MTLALRVFALLFCIFSAPVPVSAQLRPLDPIDFRAFGDNAMLAQIGTGIYFDQQASLAGTRGRLWELGDVRVAMRTGRIVIEAGGTVQRFFKDETIVRGPFGGATAPPANGRRHDAGDYRIATLVRLTSEHSATLAALRFGTRLPTTDNRVGLDRDATDFFATLGAQRRVRHLAISVEAGVSINGTRESTYEQSDVLVYALGSELRLRGITPFATLLGQQDFQETAIRGNEDLSELRAGVRVGTMRWLTAAWVHGFGDYSPSGGLQFGLGSSF